MALTTSPLQYTFSYQDAVEVLRLMRENEGLSHFELEIGDLRISVDRRGGEAAVLAPLASRVETARLPPAAVSSAVEAAAAAAPGSAAAPDNAIVVTAPMLGIFYCAPSPGAAPFVQVGDSVKAGDSIGLIEVMKLFTTVIAECDGRIARIDALDGGLVEHGQTLMLIEPSHHA
jgi:acetyl-CoA carboxylase biotin carboxyl carrier protein